jgi:hypothetical protein
MTQCLGIKIKILLLIFQYLLCPPVAAIRHIMHVGTFVFYGSYKIDISRAVILRVVDEFVGSYVYSNISKER